MNRRSLMVNPMALLHLFGCLALLMCLVSARERRGPLDAAPFGSDSTETKLASCPVECICKGLTIDCSGRGLKQVPSNLPNTVRRLFLEGNNISVIRKADLLDLGSLKVLDFHQNEITEIEDGSFDSLGQLESLRLSRNQLESLKKEQFKPLRALKELDLSKNKLQRIDGLVFYGLESLQQLKLRRNLLESLEDGAFWDLSNVQILQLDRNRISNVTKGWLYGLTNLRELGLSHNKILRIEGESFDFCRQIQELDMSHNQLQKIKKSSFQKAATLTKLFLHNNEINMIEEEAFKDLRSLEVLKLDNNDVSYVIEDVVNALAGLDNLITLGLANNSIKSISRKAFLGLRNLKTLDLSGNPILSAEDLAFSNLKSIEEVKLDSLNFICDCKLRSLVQWLKRKPRKNSIVAKCNYPKNLNGVGLLDLEIERLLCSTFMPPVIMHEPKSEIVALKGSNLTIKCVAQSSNPSPMGFVWRKNYDLLVFDNVRLRTSTEFDAMRDTDQDNYEFTNTLQIDNIDFEDSGLYQCSIQNPFGRVHARASQIHVHELPSFSKRPVNVSQRVGQTARLECAAQGQPPPEVSWTKDGGVGFPAATERRMHVQPSDDVFFIVDVQAKDQGLYTCWASNDAGKVSTNATLTVLRDPNFVKPMLDKRVSVGETAMLECRASGYPTPQLTWAKDGAAFPLTERHFLTAEDQLLIIVKVQPSDAGTYSCAMSNSLGSVQQSLRLDVLDPQARLFRSDLFAGLGNPTGLVIVASVVCVVVLTSVIWVIIIYKTRQPTPRHSFYMNGETFISEEFEKELARLNHEADQAVAATTII